MPLLSVVFILVLVGVLLWFIETQTIIPIDARIKKIIEIVIIVAVILWLLELFGVLSAIGLVRIGK